MQCASDVCDCTSLSASVRTPLCWRGLSSFTLFCISNLTSRDGDCVSGLLSWPFRGGGDSVPYHSASSQLDNKYRIATHTACSYADMRNAILITGSDNGRASYMRLRRCIAPQLPPEKKRRLKKMAKSLCTSTSGENPAVESTTKWP